MSHLSDTMASTRRDDEGVRLGLRFGCAFCLKYPYTHISKEPVRLVPAAEPLLHEYLMSQYT